MTDRRKTPLGIGIATALLLAACSSGSTANPPSDKTVPFKEARLIVEINATDGDAGFQVFLDHEPWKSITISRPDGTNIVDLLTRGVLVEYGLTELFWESSEPPFTEFPLEEFMRLWPEGDYIFQGETIDGVTMRSAVTLTHDFPVGPKILSPKEDSTVPVDGLVIRWEPVTEPAGIEIVAYQVIVVRDENPIRELDVQLPATATRFTVPTEFMQPGVEYKVEVLAIEAGGNQTLTEVPFSTQ